MDYETKALFRNDIRRLAPIFREIFGVKKEGPFPVLQALGAGVAYHCLVNTIISRIMAL